MDPNFKDCVGVHYNYDLNLDLETISDMNYVLVKSGFMAVGKGWLHSKEINSQSLEDTQVEYTSH